MARPTATDDAITSGGSDGAKLGQIAAAASPRAARFPHRILLIVPEIFSSEGGIPRILQLYLRALSDLLPPEGQIRLVALNDPTFDTSELKRTAGSRLVEWVACDRDKLRFTQTVVEFGRRSDHIVCGHVAQLPVALIARALNPRLTYDLVAHGIEVWRRPGFLERLALRRASRVYCVSDYTRRELLRRCPLREGRAVVLPNALDPAFRIEPGAPLRPDTPPVILLISRLTRDDLGKGFADMIQAMPAVLAARPEARLRIIGRGNALPQLQALATRLGLRERVEFLGHVNDRRMIEALKTCALFALPSGKEGFGLVFIEAMACGRPCLGARAGGIPEVITPATGVLPEHGDVAGIASATVAALARAWDQEAILERARHFSYPLFKERFAALLFP